MKVLKSTQSQYDELNGYTTPDGLDRLEFRKDANNMWVCGMGNKTNPAFIEIHDQLLALQEIDWLPPLPQEDL